MRNTFKQRIAHVLAVLLKFEDVLPARRAFVCQIELVIFCLDRVAALSFFLPQPLPHQRAQRLFIPTSRFLGEVYGSPTFFFFGFCGMWCPPLRWLCSGRWCPFVAASHSSTSTPCFSSSFLCSWKYPSCARL